MGAIIYKGPIPLWIKIVLVLVSVPIVIAAIYVWTRPKPPLARTVIRDPFGNWQTAISDPFVLSETLPLQKMLDDEQGPALAQNAAMFGVETNTSSSVAADYVISIFPKQDFPIRAANLCTEESLKAIYQEGLKIWQAKSTTDEFTCYATEHNRFFIVTRTKNHDESFAVELMGMLGKQIRPIK